MATKEVISIKQNSRTLETCYWSARFLIDLGFHSQCERIWFEIIIQFSSTTAELDKWQKKTCVFDKISMYISAFYYNMIMLSWLIL
jgi:hypothetical protein